MLAGMSPACGSGNYYDGSHNPSWCFETNVVLHQYGVDTHALDSRPNASLFISSNHYTV